MSLRLAQEGGMILAERALHHEERDSYVTERIIVCFIRRNEYAKIRGATIAKFNRKVGSLDMLAETETLKTNFGCRYLVPWMRRPRTSIKYK